MSIDKSILKELKEALEKCTSGEWVRGEIEGFDHSHKMVFLKDRLVNGEQVGICMTHGNVLGSYEADAEFIVLAKNHMLSLLNSYEELEKERDAILREAQCHAMAARTAQSTVYESYQAATGAKGEPGDWNGAGPIRELAASRDQMKQTVRTLADALRRVGVLQPRMLDILRNHGYKFERFPRNMETNPPTTDGERWECLAFSMYCDLCEAHATSDAALSDPIVKQIVEEK